MATQLGIDLSPERCRIIELDGRAPQRSRVASFKSMAMDDPAIRAALEAFRGRRTSVVVWGAARDHRQIIVTPGPYNRMRSEARARLRDTGVPGLPLHGILSDIAPVTPRPSSRLVPSTSSGQARSTGQAVLLASASSADVSAAVAPLLDAGLKIRSVLTPAAALQALARTGQRPAVSGLEGYVALTETATCIAIVHDGALVAARDLRWGYLDEACEFETRPRDDIARRLAEEISSFVAEYRVTGAPPLAQIAVCGGLQDLRSMAMSLTERIDVEVEALDSLSGIDQANLPETSGEFRDRIAEMQLAWAAAVVHRPALDLYRHARHRVARTYLSRVAMMGGAAVGLGIGWWVQGQWPVEGLPVLVARTAAAAPLAVEPPVVALPAAAPAVFSPAAIPFRMPEPAPPPLSVASVEAPAGAPVRRAPVRTESAPRPTPGISPITGTVGTILYGPDRQLAIVDGRIVQVGDEVSGARVTEITSGAVVLRDAQGRVKRLGVGAAGP